MFDTMTLTKILGGFCGAFLIYLLVGWGAEGLYHVGPDGHGAHGDEHAQAYTIEVESDDAPEEEVEEVDFAAIMATADAAKGEKLFSKCKACHKLEDGANGTGPHLYGVVDRDIAAIEGFGYSGGVAALEGNWTPEALDGFLANPKAYAPGTKMSFAGFKKIEDRANIIAYLATIGG